MHLKLARVSSHKEWAAKTKSEENNPGWEIVNNSWLICLSETCFFSDKLQKFHWSHFTMKKNTQKLFLKIYSRTEGTLIWYPEVEFYPEVKCFISFPSFYRGEKFSGISDLCAMAALPSSAWAGWHWGVFPSVGCSPPVPTVAAVAALPAPMDWGHAALRLLDCCLSCCSLLSDQPMPFHHRTQVCASFSPTLPEACIFFSAPCFTVVILFTVCVMLAKCHSDCREGVCCHKRNNCKRQKEMHEISSLI